MCTCLTENTIGKHTFAAINAQEKYDILSSDMNDVMKSINDLIAKPDVTISDETYSLEIIMDSDYKVCDVVDYIILLMPTKAAMCIVQCCMSVLIAYRST